jgi:hypothetical protein
MSTSQASLSGRSDRADACLATLDDAGRATARRVFLRLITADAQPAPRKPQLLVALSIGDDADRVTEVVRRFAEAGLLRVHGPLTGTATADPESILPSVELADATMIDGWPALQTWLRTHGVPEQLRRQLEADAAEWQRRASEGQRDVGLLDQSQLGELTWLTDASRRELGVSATAESFITASRAARRRGLLPGKAFVGTSLAILLMIALMLTPIILLFIVVLTAALIQKLS